MQTGPALEGVALQLAYTERTVKMRLAEFLA